VIAYEVDYDHTRQEPAFRVSEEYFESFRNHYSLSLDNACRGQYSYDWSEIQGAHGGNEFISCLWDAYQSQHTGAGWGTCIFDGAATNVNWDTIRFHHLICDSWFEKRLFSGFKNLLLPQGHNYINCDADGHKKDEAFALSNKGYVTVSEKVAWVNKYTSIKSKEMFQNDFLNWTKILDTYPFLPYAKIKDKKDRPLKIIDNKPAIICYGKSYFQTSKNTFELRSHPNQIAVYYSTKIDVAPIMYTIIDPKFKAKKFPKFKPIVIDRHPVPQLKITNVKERLCLSAEITEVQKQKYLHYYDQAKVFQKTKPKPKKKAVYNPEKFIRRIEIQEAMIKLSKGEKVIVPPSLTRVKENISCTEEKRIEIPDDLTPELLCQKSLDEIKTLCTTHGLRKTGSSTTLLNALRTHFCTDHAWDYFDIEKKKKRKKVKKHLKRKASRSGAPRKRRR
jgi:hypothetical protein